MSLDDRVPVENDPYFWLRFGSIGCVVTIVALLVGAYVAFRIYERDFEMRRFPARLAVAGAIYTAEENLGFGPGGNETGLIIYRLEQSDAQRLVRQSASLTDDQSIRAALGRAKLDYGMWRRTPVEIDSEPRRWGRPARRNPSLIVSYLGVYGARVSLDPAIVQAVDHSLSAAGAYYAYGPGGSLIVVAPAEGRVIFAYAG